MEKIRGFEKVRRLSNQEIRLPERSTEYSAGYDFFAIEDVDIKYNQIMVIRTGVKAYMLEDEGLFLYNRSSNPRKKSLILMNGVGVIDADYYDNEENEGEIGFMFMNTNPDMTVSIKAGDKLGQGVFQKILLADGDVAGGKRKGGFGSTGK